MVKQNGVVLVNVEVIRKTHERRCKSSGDASELMVKIKGQRKRSRQA